MKLVRRMAAVALVLAVTAAIGFGRVRAGQSRNQPPATGPQPKMVVDSVIHDFGELKPGTPIRHAFKIRNEGKADLIIESVSPG